MTFVDLVAWEDLELEVWISEEIYADLCKVIDLSNKSKNVEWVVAHEN